MAAIALPAWSDGRISGLVFGLVDLDSAAIKAPLSQAASLGVTGHASLVDQDGRSLFTTLDIPFQSPGEHSTFYRKAMLSRQALIETVPFESDLPEADETRGEKHVMAFARLKVEPWGVAVGGDLDETFAGVGRLRLGMVILGGLTLACVWAATLVGTRSLLGPVRELTAAAQRIADGRLRTPLPASQDGEIGVMANALERMRLQLLSSIEALADWNDTLEARVREQTDSLRQQQAITRHLLRQVISAQEEERGRLARELHDEIGQTLTAVELGLERLATSLPPGESTAQRRLEQMRALTERALVDL